MYYARDALNCVQARKAIRIYKRVLQVTSDQETYDDAYQCMRVNESKLGICLLALLGYGPLAF